MKHEQTLFEQLRAIGATLDHHESDLYVRADQNAVELVRAWAKDHDYSSRFYRYFTSDIDRRQWIEIPFHYDPFWTAKLARGHA